MTLAFVIRYWREGLLLAATIVLLGAWHSHNVALTERGQAIERARVADSTLAALRPQLAHVDTLVVHDTVRVARLVARVDTLRDTLLAHITDTVRVRQYIARTDSALAACTELSHDCASFRVSANQTIAALQAKLAVATAVHPTSCVRSNLITATLSVAGGYLLHGLHRQQ